MRDKNNKIINIKKFILSFPVELKVIITRWQLLHNSQNLDMNLDVFAHPLHGKTLPKVLIISRPSPRQGNYSLSLGTIFNLFGPSRKEVGGENYG